jgi:hypothetical protein
MFVGFKTVTAPLQTASDRSTVFMNWRVDPLVILALLGGFALLATGTISSGPYDYDESDYMYAVSQGVFANWSDSPTLSLPEFIRLGLQQGLNSDQRSVLSEQVRNSDDMVFYRHHHGPFYYYWLVAVSAEGKRSEHTMRVLTLTFHVLTFLIIYFGCLWVRPGPTGRLAAILCSLLYLWSYANIRTASEIAPHSAFVLCYISSLLLLAKLFETGDRRYWYGAVVAAALAFCTLEVSFILAATLVMFAFVERNTLFPNWKWRDWRRFTLRSVAVFVGVVLLVWPAAIFKLSFTKAYFFMTYLAVFRKTPWDDLTLTQTWALRFSRAPVEWGLVVLSLFVFALRRKHLKGVSYAWVLLCFAGMMLLTCLRVTSGNPRYISPFFPALQVFSGIVLASAMSGFRAPVRYLLLAPVAILLFWSAHRQYMLMPLPSTHRETALLEYVKSHGLEHKFLLVQGMDVPLFHYYFPHIRLRSYVEEQEIPELLHGVDGVLYTSAGIRYQPAR